MSRPGILLLVLIVLAALAGRVLIHVHDTNTSDASSSSTNADGATPGGTDPAPPKPLTTTAESGAAGAMESQLLNEAFQISKARSLTFPEALDFVPTSAAGIQKAWQNERNSQFPSDTLERLGLTWQLLGILPEDEDLTARYRLRSSLSRDVLYDAQNRSLLHTETIETKKPEPREWLTRQLMRLLLDQNFRWREALIPAEVNLDRMLAQQAFVTGDTTWQTLKFTETDAVASHAWKRTDTLTNNWPKPLRMIEFLGMRDGVHFCQAVSSQNVALDSIYQQLPTSTAHILHPDRYLETPRWNPQKLRWAQLDVHNSEPVWDNVIGELLIRSWLESVALPEDAGLIAAGWEGDGVLLYQTTSGTPQLAWKSAWRDSSHADRFFNLVRAQAPKLFGVSIPTQQQPKSITYEDLLSLKIQAEDNTVTIIRWTEDSWKEALESLASRSSFEKNKP